jgi:hypothetical protein
MIVPVVSHSKSRGVCHGSAKNQPRDEQEGDNAGYTLRQAQLHWSRAKIGLETKTSGWHRGQPEVLEIKTRRPGF